MSSPLESSNAEAIGLTIPTPDGPVPISVSGKPTFILGRNGTGKSALVHHIRGQLQSKYAARLIYLPGSRPSYFDGESLNMTPNGRQQFENNSASWDLSPDIRVRPISGTTRNERAIFDLQASEIQYHVDAAYDVKKNGVHSASIQKLQANSSPLDRANRLLLQANLPIQVTIDSGELRACRDGNTYSISRMSDGERTALIFIADVIAAKPGSLFLVDEPELHLHRSIVVRLVSALLAERPDCEMVISTHELNIPIEHPDSQLILVRGCSWEKNGAVRNWQVDLLADARNIPEDLRVDLLGSRRKILFVEGTASSLDQPLYESLFPLVSVRQKDSCVEVRRAVTGLRQVEQDHHAEAYGLVDNDAMGDEYKQKLLGEGVFALPMFSVESIYYSEDVLRAVARRQAETFGIDEEAVLSEAITGALTKLKQAGKIEHLAARVSERRMRDELLARMPTRSQLLSSADGEINVAIPSAYPTVLAHARSLLEAGDLHGIIRSFPIRETGALGSIAKGLHFNREADFERAALAAINGNSDLQGMLKAKLGDLADKLS